MRSTDTKSLRPPKGLPRRSKSNSFPNQILVVTMFSLGFVSLFFSSSFGALNRYAFGGSEMAQYNSYPHDTEDYIRVIALCVNSEEPESDFDIAFRRMSELIPLWYAGMYPYSSNGEEKASCEDQIEQWMVRELQRRQILAANITTAIEVIYIGQNKQQHRFLNDALVGQSKSKEPNKWVGGMHTPSQRTHFKRFIRNWGEVASSKLWKCSPDDYSIIHAYRSRQLWTEAQEENCAVIHLPVIMAYAKSMLKYRIENGVSPPNETLISLLTHQRTLDEARQSLNSKSNFCILITMTTFQPRYSTDALVRHALCRLLTKQYKPCVAVRSWKGENMKNISLEKPIGATYKSMLDFKFVITMPNHFQDGYIAEKTLHPYFANSVAITSIPNIGKYVNAQGMIACRLPEEELRKVQAYYKGSFRWMPFNTTPDMWQSNGEIKPIKYDPYANNKTGDEPVLEFATSQWEKALQPCIQEIIRIDQDDNAYMKKLTQPYLLNGGHSSMFDGTYIAMSMLRWFLWANSPLVKGLEGTIQSLDGMREQTPGWGTI